MVGSAPLPLLVLAERREFRAAAVDGIPVAGFPASLGAMLAFGVGFLPVVVAALVVDIPIVARFLRARSSFR
ncbi:MULTISPECIES: hypothetical protein [unclassified Saccharothrix]|uniref:hypothetical protein n=1 Tax=unclassified Saccharothrix TaxID=2593673 RepID=UPI00307D7502